MPTTNFNHFFLFSCSYHNVSVTLLYLYVLINSFIHSIYILYFSHIPFLKILLFTLLKHKETESEEDRDFLFFIFKIQASYPGKSTALRSKGSLLLSVTVGSVRKCFQCVIYPIVRQNMNKHSEHSISLSQNHKKCVALVSHNFMVFELQ